MQTAIETTGTVSAHGIILDEGLPLKERSRVRVIVFLDRSDGGDDLNESEWLKSASKNEVFDLLAEEEDIYSLADGKSL